LSRGQTLETQIPDIKARQDNIIKFALQKIVGAIHLDSPPPTA
jgi:hypothetical protein